MRLVKDAICVIVYPGILLFSWFVDDDARTKRRSDSGHAPSFSFLYGESKIYERRFVAGASTVCLGRITAILPYTLLRERLLFV